MRSLREGSRPRREPALDGLRALAVIAVLLFHGGVSWMPAGYLGVSLFFTLSGFLITRLLLDEVQATGTIALGIVLRPPDPAPVAGEHGCACSASSSPPAPISSPA